MVHQPLAVPLVLLASVAACARPHPIAGLGPEPALAPVTASLHTKHADTVHVDLTMTRTAYVTVLDVERRGSVRVLVPRVDMASVSLDSGTHHLALRPALRAVAAPAMRPDPVPGILGSMGISRGTFLPPSSIEGVGSIPLEECLDSSPSEPRFCPVLPTKPLVPPQRTPPTRYLLVIATERPLTLGELQERLTGVELSADGRELLTGVAQHAAGTDARWAAYGVRR